ncbi:DUF456 domain-containing protein [Brevibacterium otitidis]|uniref:DUF456 domain-containing protein n=1 Tax=Brevibacterium otitidis TaxID=53364 RepID=A0ABV5X2B0_9MICO|nr:DUF456 domain-containing protein [Brevibacterium otitidis]
MSAEIITTIIAGLAMLVGCIGIIVPVLPGSILIAISAIVWAIVQGSMTGWVVLAVILLLVGIGMTASWVLTGKRLKDRQIPNSSLFFGILGLVIGFILGIFVFGVGALLGMLVGFVAGLYLAELQRLKDAKAAWGSSWTAIKAFGIGMIIEFLCAVTSLTVFVAVNIIVAVAA